MMRIILFIIFLLGGSLPAAGQQQQDDEKAEYLMPVEFDYRYKSEVFAIMIDARTERQYRGNRIAGATGIDRMAELKVFADTMDSETPLYIYCDGESRSRTVAEYLNGEGFSRLYILRGGIREWEAAGLPIDKKRVRRRK